MLLLIFFFFFSFCLFQQIPLVVPASPHFMRCLNQSPTSPQYFPLGDDELGSDNGSGSGSSDDNSQSREKSGNGSGSGSSDDSSQSGEKSGSGSSDDNSQSGEKSGSGNGGSVRSQSGEKSGSRSGSSISSESGEGNDDADDNDDDDDDDDDDDGSKRVKVSKGAKCTFCKKSFPNEKKLISHLTTAHLKRKFECETCGKVYGRVDTLKRHQKNHAANKQVSCPICGKRFARRDCLAVHIRQVHRKRKQPPPPKTRRPKRNQKHINQHPDSTSDSDEHDMNDPDGAGDRPTNSQVANDGVSQDNHEDDDENEIQQGVREDPEDVGVEEEVQDADDDDDDDDPDEILREDPDEMPAPPEEDVEGEDDHDNVDQYDDDDDDDDEGRLYDDLYRDNWRSIRTHHRYGRRVQDVYNFRIGGGRDQVGGGGGGGVSVMERRLRAIFNRQRQAFKINMSYGYILRNVETGELRYYHSSLNNHRYFDVPPLISNRDDLDEFIRRVQEASPSDYAIRGRPTTKWTVVAVTNVTFYLYKMTFNIGAGNQVLPAYVMNNPAINALVKNFHGRPYKDNLCFFRCIALHKGGHPANLERDAKYYFDKYLEMRPQREFQGVTLEEMTFLEKLFETNIQVFSLVEEQAGHNDDSDDEEDDDDDDITDNNKVDGDDDDDDDDDDRTPSVSTELVWRTRCKFPTTMNLNLYDRHFSYIKNIRMYSKKYRCLRCDKLFDRASRLTRHEISCDGNVVHVFPGGPYKTPSTVFEKLEAEGIETSEDMRYFPHRATFDFECFFEEVASGQTTKTKVEAHHVPLSVSVASNVKGYEETKHFVTEGDSHQLVSSMIKYLEEIGRASYELLFPDYAILFEALDDKMISIRNNPMIDKKIKKKRERQLERLQEDLDSYLFTLPVIGFNSSRYDINLVKEFLFPVIMKEGSVKFIVKKGSSYPCITTTSLRFLDIMNYLAPGYSYRDFLKAYGAEVGKGYFPYEWMTSLDKLDHPTLPEHHCFFSKLKNSNITEEEYAFCQEVWESRQMTSMRDFLMWYNDLDVQPFLVALENLFKFYTTLKIDMFKDAQSVPGVTLKYLFSTLGPDVFFTLFNQKDKHLYYKMRESIVGGPSIIFHRYHEKGETYIRNGPRVCEEVVGFDANALYLWALMQPMPTGIYITRSADDGFRPAHAYAHGEMAVEWLDWLASTEGIEIQHQYNKGEKRIGARQIPVDGFCATTNTVYQFQGCYYHGHNCKLTNGKTWNQTRRCSMADLRQETEDISAYIRDEGFNLIEIYECAWLHLKRTDQDVGDFVRNHKSPLRQRRSMTLESIKEAILDDTLFGVVECDVHVPSHLRDYFSEMPPIFKNCMVSKDDIGQHMAEFADENGIMQQPRRTLVSSMKGDKIMLITPLLKWYLQHGLDITAVYSIIEYQPRRCFSDFADTVVEARRAGDKDPCKAIIAETMKLIGNSAYGKTITNKERFTDVELCTEEEAPKKVNCTHFHHLTPIGEDHWEVEMSKKRIKMDLPIQIGFFVYGYAKLRMLSFFYDFVDKFIDRCNYQYCAMDTDSAYMALAGPFESLVKEEMREEYEDVKHSWFPRSDTEENIAYDRREPGLLKEEWRGDGIVALCSKTYYCFGGKKDKMSCKGLNKRQPRPLTAQRYLDALSSKSAGSGVNRGFRLVNGKMVTYIQQKNALSYLYIKRKVADDGISTSPLDV